MAKSSYSLHLIKLKLHVQLDHDVEQRVLFRVYSPPNIRVKPLRKYLINFLFPAKSTYSLHPIKLKLDL